MSRSEKRTNIAFKCNYCDGGKELNGIGFAGICTKSNLRYNIEVHKYRWCINEECPCKEYYDGHLSYGNLVKSYRSDIEPCQDSIVLKHWKAHTQMSGNSYEQESARTIKYRDSLAVLTTRMPQDKEEDRFIFAVFLIKDYTAKFDERSGLFSAQKNYRFILTLEKAKTLKFWNYYNNRIGSRDHIWGSGLQRNLADDDAIRILQDIVKVRKNDADKDIARKFLRHYCDLHPVDVSSTINDCLS